MVVVFEDRKKERREGRVAHLLREELSRILRKEVSDPRVRGVLVTDVQLTDKMRFAKVKVCRSILEDLQEPSEDEKNDLISGLQSAASHIQKTLRKNVDLRSVPFLQFYYDRNVADASRVWKTMREVH